MNEETIQLLKAAISDCITGPGGDPDSSHLWAAARIAVALQKVGIEIDSYYLDVLQGKNLEEYDYISGVNEFPL